MQLVSKREIKDGSGATHYLVQKIVGQLQAKAVGRYGAKLYESEKIIEIAEKELSRPRIQLKTKKYLKEVIIWVEKKCLENQQNKGIKLITYDGGKSLKYEGLTSKQKELAMALGNMVKDFQELNNFLDQEDKELKELL